MVDKSPEAVLDEVEAAIFMVANSILTGNGFSYSVPSRAKGNQLCGPTPGYRRPCTCQLPLTYGPYGASTFPTGLRTKHDYSPLPD